MEARGTLTYIHKSKFPANKRLLPTTTVLRQKEYFHGNPTLRKARCTIRGDRQIEGLQYDPSNLSRPLLKETASALPLLSLQLITIIRSPGTQNPPSYTNILQSSTKYTSVNQNNSLAPRNTQTTSPN